MEYSISLIDIFNIAKKHIKVILICALIFGLLAGAFGFIKSQPQKLTAAEQKQATTEQKVYEEYSEKKEEVKSILQEKLVDVYRIVEEHPIMQTDPENTTQSILVFTLNDNSEAERNITFSAWTDKLSAKELFGTDDKLIEKYRSEYVNVSGAPGEVRVSVLDAPKYDHKKVAKKLKTYLEDQAKKNNVKVVSSENTLQSGYSQQIVDRQVAVNNLARTFTDQLNILNNYNMEAPSMPNTERSTKDFMKLFLLIVAGLIFGAIVGIVIVSFNVIRKGTVLSAGHVSDFFGIEHLVTGSVNDASLPRMVNSVINAIDEGSAGVLVTSNGHDDKFEQITKTINESADREYVFADVSADDVAVLDKMHSVAGAIVPVTIGKTTYKDIQESVRWIQKFKKNLYGYVVVE